MLDVLDRCASDSEPLFAFELPSCMGILGGNSKP